MPQMAPMNWLLLYFIFTLIFFLFNFMNYYSFIIKNNMKSSISNKYIQKNFNWKW
uniref:ATP synthase complex subunit 8 n=1 Tax=Hexagonia terminalis TaxID=1205596 RepID=A0A0S2MPF9_9CARA|nr:ATP synthase F0 subunit 8 [Hexagonia terminalis]